MKLQINTKEKIIKLEESVNLGELFTQLEELLPNMKWREYTLERNIIWNNPYVVPCTPQYVTATPCDPLVPSYIITCDTNKSNIT